MIWQVCMKSGWSVTISAAAHRENEVWMAFFDKDPELAESETETIAEMHQWEDDHQMAVFAVQDISVVIPRPRPPTRAVWRP
jgi:hypothetical protein